MIALIIFDVDGTLAEWSSLALLPGVQDFFDLLGRGNCASRPGVAIATNQGGVAMHEWIERENSLGGHEMPSTGEHRARQRREKQNRYPTQAQVEERMRELTARLDAAFRGGASEGGTSEGGASQGAAMRWYAAYAYQNKLGHWIPTQGHEDDPRWSQDWRKPAPGMLRQAMQDANVPPEQTLYVGDSDDDQKAAEAAGCGFRLARDFFARDWHTCQALADILNFVAQ